MTRKPNKGKVILAGAGPGDPELLTLKAFRYLQAADVVITDRLVSPQILENYVRPEALVLHVGKQSHNGDSTPQSLTNELMVEYALQGKLVVRLKGGDLAFFANILEELQALCTHGISYEMIPGVTAASGAAAYAGIPLTARGYANGVRLLTYYKTDLLEDTYWQDLASTLDTLVFYMSSNTLDDLVARLLDFEVGQDKWIAVIEQATTPVQRVFGCPIHEYRSRWGGQQYISPALIIIGKVASLHQQFQWMEQQGDRLPYFDSVTKKTKADARA
jgi:uroporphyrin-III C-methyltransferase